MAFLNNGTPSKSDLVEGRLLFHIIGAWVISSLVIGYSTYVILPSVFPAWAGDIDRLSAVIVAEVYFLFLVILVAGLGGVARTRERIHINQIEIPGFGLTAVLWMGAYLASFIGYATISAIHPAFPQLSELISFLLAIGTDMGRLNGADFPTVVVVLLRACLFAPIAEELLFRGALFSWIRGHESGRLTIVLTAAAFAGIHGMMSSTMLPLAFAVGIAAGYARERTGSVTPAIMVHVIQNVVVVIAGVSILL